MLRAFHASGLAQEFFRVPDSRLWSNTLGHRCPQKALSEGALHNVDVCSWYQTWALPAEPEMHETVLPVYGALISTDNEAYPHMAGSS